MKLNYLDIIVKKDLIIEQLRKRLEDKEYDIGMIQMAHDGIQLRERHQNGEIRELQEKYNKMTDMCKVFDQSFRLLSNCIGDYLESKYDSYDLEKEYERILKGHEEKLVNNK